MVLNTMNWSSSVLKSEGLTQLCHFATKPNVHYAIYQYCKEEILKDS